MTLGEVLASLKEPPEIGSHEIVLDKHGVAHILVVTGVQHRGSAHLFLACDVDFMCLCELLGSETREVRHLEVAPVATCIRCLTR